MSAMHDTSTDWMAEAVRLRQEEQMATADIAERVDRSASRVRRVLAEANAARFTGDTGQIPGQTTVDDHLTPGDPEVQKPQLLGYDDGKPVIYGAPDAPEDDPERDVDPLDEFKAEAGEAVGPMPPQEPEAVEPVTETRIRGTRQMALDFGAEADIPIGGTIVLKSDKLASGFFDMGDVITGTFTARITDIVGKEKFDPASEEFRAKPTGHVATITEFTVDM